MSIGFVTGEPKYFVLNVLGFNHQTEVRSVNLPRASEIRRIG